MEVDVLQTFCQRRHKIRIKCLKVKQKNTFIINNIHKFKYFLQYLLKNKKKQIKNFYQHILFSSNILPFKHNAIIMFCLIYFVFIKKKSLVSYFLILAKLVQFLTSEKSITSRIRLLQFRCDDNRQNWKGKTYPRIEAPFESWRDWRKSTGDITSLEF